MKSEKEYRENLKSKLKGVKTDEDFFRLISYVKNDQHDYGTICVGIAQAMIATLEHINRSPNGGITGFQASHIGWEVFRESMGLKDQPLSLRMYENMLYPQYESKFQKTLPFEIWVWLKKEAKKKYEACEGESLTVSRVREHWKSIVNGQVPFGYVVEGEQDEG